MGFFSAGRLATCRRRLALVALLSLVLATGGVAPCAAARTYPGEDKSRGRSLSQEHVVLGRASVADLAQGQGQGRQDDSFRGADDGAGHADPVAVHFSRKLLTGRGSTHAQALQQVRAGVDTQSFKVKSQRLARKLGPYSKHEDAAGSLGRFKHMNQNEGHTHPLKGGRQWGRNLQEKVPGTVGEAMEVQQQPVVPAGPKEEHLFFAWSVLIGLGVASALVFLVMFCQHCLCSKKRRAAVVPLDGEEVADARVAGEAQEAREAREDEGRGNSNVMPELQEHEIPQGALYGLFS